MSKTAWWAENYFKLYGRSNEYDKMLLCTKKYGSFYEASWSFEPIYYIRFETIQEAEHYFMLQGFTIANPYDGD